MFQLNYTFFLHIHDTGDSLKYSQKELLMTEFSKMPKRKKME